MSTNPAAEELLATLAKRRAVLTCLVEAEESIPKQTLIDHVGLSQPTVDKVLDELRDWGVIESNSDGITPTLLGTLVWTTSCMFDQRLTEIATVDKDDIPLWSTTAERQEVREVVANRVKILEHVKTTPRDKRNLLTNLDASRSTVNRAIRELEVVGLVTRTAAGYTTTAAGRQATDQYRTAVETVDDILSKRNILDALPHDYPLHPALLADAAVERAADTMPYHPLEDVRERIAAAERVRVCLPVLPTPQLLDWCHRGIVQEGLSVELLTSPDLFETLTAEFPGPLATMAGDKEDSCTACVADIAPTGLPPFGIVLAETDESTTVSVIAYDKEHTIQSMIHNDTVSAVQWAEDCYARARDNATDVTDDLHDIVPTEQASVIGGLSTVSNTERVAREAEGFVKLTPEYFTQRTPAPPMTSWRTGFDLVDVHTGYAIDREVEHDGIRHNLTDNLVECLRKSTNHAILGPPGSGKSTVCKSVACRWYEQGIGPVFFRASGTRATFTSPTVLREQLRVATTNGHVLVVVEDAVRAEANAIFRVMQAFRGNGNVTFLLDARTGEWDDPKMLPTDAGLEAYRNEAIETVTVPTLDAQERERFVRQFEQTTNYELDSAAAHRFQESETIAAAQTQDSERASAADGTSDLLLFLHRMVMHADPLAIYDTNTPTTLVEEIQRFYEDLQESGDLALDVGVLVNLLNAAGIGVHPDLVCALAVDEDERGIDAVRDILSSLEGRVLFGRKEDTGIGASYRTVHEAWSSLFLDHLLETTTEQAASRRFGRAITALLALADEEARRDRIRGAFMGDSPAIKHIADAPDEWVDTTVEQLFGLGLRRRNLAPLFGKTNNSFINLPDICSQSVKVDCTKWRGNMATEAGDFDRAAHEYESLADLAADIETTDPEWATTLYGKRLHGLGLVAYHKGEIDSAEAYYTSAVDHYRDAGKKLEVARTHANLGNVAYTRGNLETAETYYQQSLDMFRKLEHPQSEGPLLANLGEISMILGELGTAVDYYEQCLTICREVNDRRRKAICFINLGKIDAHRGNLDTGADYCTQALNLVRELGSSDWEAESLVNLGRISQTRGDFKTTETYYRRSLDIRQKIGDKKGEVRSLTALGSLAYERGAFDTAMEHCMTSCEISQKISYPLGEARSLTVLGEIAHDRRDLGIAEERARDGLSMHQEIGHSLGAAICRRLLGLIARDRTEFTTAENYLTQVLTDVREMGYRYEEARTLAALGTLARRKDTLGRTRERFGDALELYHEIGAIRDSIETGEQLAAVCETRDDLDAALGHCETAYELALNTEFTEPPASLTERRDRLDNRCSDDSGG
jgi:tetratricopeptide (TPR) repeat protein/predicted transcriptional regulator